MKNPPHPGEIIRELCLKPLGLTVTGAAQGLGVTRKTLSLLLNGHAGVSPEMAVRLSQAFGRSPESWLQLQAQYDLAQVKRSAKEIKIQPLYDLNRPQPQ
jgi:addiction module HigA family antidote